MYKDMTYSIVKNQSHSMMYSLVMFEIVSEYEY